MPWEAAPAALRCRHQAAGSAQRACFRLTHTPEVIDAWVRTLRTRCNGQPIAIGLERNQGPLVSAVRQSAFLVLFPIHPLPLARYRAAFTPSRATDDPTDAALQRALGAEAHRDGVADQLPTPAGQKRVAVDRALLAASERLHRDVAVTLVQTAQEHKAPVLARWHSVPGIGKMLRLVLLAAIHAIHRFPRGPACVSSCRLVNCAKDSAGKRSGPADAQRGHTQCKGTLADAAVLLLRNTPAAQQERARLAHTQGQGKAFPICVPTCARAVYSRRKRATGCDMQQCRTGKRSGAEEPNASRDEHGLSLAWGALIGARRQGTRQSPEALSPGAVGLCWDIRCGAGAAARGAPAPWVRPLPRTWTARANALRCATTLHRPVCGPGSVARPQWIASTLLCTRHRHGDSTSRSVWGRHRKSVPG